MTSDDKRKCMSILRRIFCFQYTKFFNVPEQEKIMLIQGGFCSLTLFAWSSSTDEWASPRDNFVGVNNHSTTVHK